MARPSRLRRIAKLALKVLLGIFAGVILLVVVALLSLDFGPVRGLIVSQTNSALESMFRGRLIIDRIGHVDLGGVKDVDLEIRDPAGKTVVRARNAEVSLAWPRLVYNAVRGGSEPLLVHVRRASVADLQVWLIDDGTGTPTLAHAFDPQKPSPPSQGPGTRVVVDEITVAIGKVRGALAGPGPIETDLARLKASLTNDARGTDLGVSSLDFDARRIPQVERVRGKLDARAFLATDPEKSKISAKVDAEARAIKAVARVSGPFDDLLLELEAQREAASLRAKGRFQNDGRVPVLEAHLEAQDLDVSQLVPDGPKTDVSMNADAQLRFEDSGLRGKLNAETSAESRFQDYALPGVTLTAAVAVPKSGPTSVDGELQIAEPGARTRAEFAVRSSPAGVVAEVQSRSELDDSQRIAVLTGGLRAQGPLRITGKYDGAADRLEARAELTARNVRHPALRSQSVHVVAEARGSTKAPQLSATVTASRVTVADRTLTRAKLEATGTPDRLAVRARIAGKDPDSVEVAATVTPNGKELVRDVVARLANPGAKLELRARALSTAGGKLSVDNLTIDGAGSVELSAVYGRTLEKLELRARELEPVKALSVFGIQTEIKQARVDLDASLHGPGKLPEGKVTAKARQVSLGKFQNGTADVELELEKGKLTGNLAVALGEGANAKISMQELTTRGPLSEAGDLRNLSGALSVVGDIDLKRVAPLFPIAGVERATGRVQLDAALEAQPGKGPPKARLAVESHKLLVVGQRKDAGNTNDPGLARETAPWTLRGMDVNLDAKVDDAGGRVEARLFDEHGTLVELSAKLAGLSLAPERLRGAALMATPFEAKLNVPGRALERLPTPIRPNDLRGAIALDVQAKGTFTDPKVEALVTLAHFGPVNEREDPRGLGVFVEAKYSRAEGSLRVQADGRRGQVIALDSRWQGDVAELGKATENYSPVRGSLKAEITEFPLAVIPILRDRQVRGRVSGRAELEGFGADARLSLELETRRLRVEQLVLERLTAKVGTNGKRIEFEARLDGAGGSAGAKVSTGFVWGKKTVPEVDQNLEGSLFAKNLRLAAFAPAVAGSVSELDGRLDAQFSAKIEGGTPKLEGRAALKGGVVQLPKLGQRFHDIQGTVEVSPGRVRVPELRARGLSGGFRAQADARLDGVTPVSFDGSVDIPEDDKLPLTIEGESVGDAWGKVEARYRRDERARESRLQIDVKRLHVELPELAPQGIQPLDQDPRIRVGYRRRDGEFTAIPLQPIEEEAAPGEKPAEKTVIGVNLGEVSIKKGQQANVTLTGKVQATLGDELDVRGRIDTRRGTLDISGKKFEIERGSVTFTGGEPDNPTISAVARYDSPAGYTVYAEYTGTAKQGKLRLNSDPPLSQDEILTLLLFGTPEGSFGAGSGDSLSTAVGVAGGTAAQGLNRALASVTDLDVSARIDTSTGAPRPELVVQLTPRVAARVTQALGEPAPGQSPDRTFLTVEFRFARAWSLSTQVGDKGASAVDLIWRKRY